MIAQKFISQPLPFKTSALQCYPALILSIPQCALLAALLNKPTTKNISYIY
jgi:hypothetical protein